jgi:hypothetical protein
MCQELFPEEVQPEEVNTRHFCMPDVAYSNSQRSQGQFFFNEEEVPCRPSCCCLLLPDATVILLFFSPPQVANGAQAEGLERWDAALEVSALCLFV